MGRHKITGNSKCPYLDKGGNLCQKLGRYNSTINAGNTNHQFAKKIQYVQFMHNDGSKKHYIPLKTYYLEIHKGHFFEKELNFFTEGAITFEELGNLFKKFEQKIFVPHYEKFTDNEKSDLQKMIQTLEDICEIQFEAIKLQKIIYVDYIMKYKKPPGEITERLKQITKDLGGIDRFQLFRPLINIFLKYEVPRRKKKWKIAHDKQKNWPLGSSHIRKGVYNSS